MAVRILGGKDGLEISSKGVGKLFRSGGVRAVRILQVGNTVLSISFDNGVVEKGGVPITFDSPFFFGSLDVVGFIFSKEFMVLLGKMVLQ